MEEQLKKLYARYEKERDSRLRDYLKDMSLKHLTYNHLYYLSAIQFLKTPTLSQLSNFMSLSNPSVTNMVNKLIAEGLLEKNKNPKDQRSSIVSLSDLGKEVMSYEEKTFIQVAMGFLSKLDDEDYIAIKRVIEKTASQA